MRSRFTVLSFTFAGMLGLILVGLLFHGPHEQKASAQRAVLRSNNSSTGTVASDSGPVRVGSNPYQPARFRQAHRGLQVATAEPILVAIKQGPQLSGEPVDLNVVQFETLFGPVAIPVNTIAGVRMADDPRQPATICLSNGDSLSGVLATDSVTIKTPWGGATIGRDHIVSIVTSSEPVTWQQREGRWTIVQATDEVSAEDDQQAYQQVEAENAAPPLN